MLSGALVRSGNLTEPVLSTLESINWLYSLSGFFIGMLVGCTGVGGGSLMTPLLVLLFGISPTTAGGTELLYAAVTKSGGTLVHGRNKTIDWQITLRLAAGSVPATIVTIAALGYYGQMGKATGGLITTFLGFTLLLTAVALIARMFFLRQPQRAGIAVNEGTTRVLTIVLGAVLGVLVSATSVGAGAIGVTALLVLYPRLPVVRIVGSDIAHAVPLTLIAGAGHWLIGSIDWNLLFSLLIGSLPGIAIGSSLAARAPDRLLSVLLAATLVVVGSRLVL